MGCLARVFVVVSLFTAPASAQADWTLLTTTTKPGSRFGCAAVYETHRLRFLMFGGGTWQNPSFYGDTWGLTLAGWVQLRPTTSPSARGGHRMAFDSLRNRTVLFGGTNGNTETWGWDGSNWSLIPTNPTPPGRAFHSMSYDPVRKVVVMFAGTSVVLGDMNDTWEWNGTSWTRKKPTVSPPRRCYQGMTYDPVSKRVLIHGGFDPKIRRSHRDTWAWDGVNWTQIATNGPRAFGAGLVYDDLRQRVVLHGGYGSGGTTHEWDGKAWTVRLPKNPPPLAGNAAYAYDRVRQRVVRFGGEGNNQAVFDTTWLYGTKEVATYTAYGTACASSAGTPTLSVGGARPWIGDTLFVNLSGAPAGTPALMSLGYSNKRFGLFKLPLDLTPMGAPGCSVLASLDWLSAAVTDTAGKASHPIPLPLALGLVGVAFYNQWLISDPKKNALQLVTSNGGAATIGVR